MKMTRKLIPLLLCLMMIVAVFAATASAAATETNMVISVTQTEVNVGDTFDVKIGIKEMTTSSVAIGFDFDNTMVEVTGITGQGSAKITYEYEDDFDGTVSVDVGAQTASTKDEANSSGHIGFVWANANEVTYKAKTQVFMVRFKALKAGTVQFKMFEDSAGTDGYKATWTAAETVTIKTATPTCNHETTKLVSSGNGTHNVVCANTDCGQIVTENVACTGTDDGDCTTAVNCECGNVITEAKAAHEAGEDDGDCTTAVKCANCDKNAVEGAKEHAFNSKASNQQNTPADCENAATYFVQCDNCDAVSKQHFVKVSEANGHGSVKGFGYVTNNNGTHNVVCQDCSKTTKENVTCDYTYDSTNHKCVCGKVETFVITWVVNGVTTTETYEYGVVPSFKGSTDKAANGCINYKFIGWRFATNASSELKTELPAVQEAVTYVAQYQESLVHVCEKKYNVEADTHTLYWSCNGSTIEANVPHIYDHQTGDFECDCGAKYTGWSELIDGEDHTTVYKRYVLDGAVLYGWNNVDGDWYYFHSMTGARTTGVARVPYPTVEINGVKYAPNQEDIDYAINKGIAFKDATMAWFVFDENGKFQNTKTGIENGKYVNKGMIGWHHGSAEVDGKCYYFVGDTENGGNKMAEGAAWVTRTNGVTGLAYGACYYFQGGLVVADMTAVKEGKYFENGKYMIGAGLVKVGEDYYYVRSSGALATGKYYITKTNDMEGFTTGMKLYFAEDGKMLPIKNGVVEENGALYYYVNNSLQAGAGLVKIDGSIYYVRSSGKVATGTYYITKTNDMEGFKAGDKLVFGEDGKLITAVDKNGIVEENGALYYYVRGHIAYGAGLIEINGDIYYVRSNGQVATGVYYVSNTNGMEGFTAGEKLTFGEDGKLIK